MTKLRKISKAALFLGELIATLVVMALVAPIWLAVELASIGRPRTPPVSAAALKAIKSLSLLGVQFLRLSDELKMFDKKPPSHEK